MGRIPDQTIEQIRDRVDIVDLIGRFVTLKKAGRSYKGLCPFHDEKTPSFNVTPDRGSFHCFGCQEGGNAFTFLMKVENLTFPEAVRVLGRELGIDIPENDTGDRGASERLIDALEVANECYRKALAQPGNPGAAYLEKRGADPEFLERFQVGFAPDAWDTVVKALRSRGIPAEVGETAGLLSARSSGGHYDRLRGRVIFPIKDVRGRIIGFGGRAVLKDQEPKYLNTPETPVFHKRESFYGFPMALEPIRRADRAIVVEGYFDLVALHRAGMANVVATCGTALTREHAKNLRRRTKEVVLLFDGDEAGQKAVERSLEVLVPEGLRVRAALLPAGQDPDDFLGEHGAEALQKLVAEAEPAMTFAIRRAIGRGVATAWEKADAVAAVAPMLALVPSAVERGELVRQLALAAGTEPQSVEAAVRAAGSGRSSREIREAMPAAPVRREPLGPEERNLRLLARCLLEFPQLAAEVELVEVQEALGDAPLQQAIHVLAHATPDALRDFEGVLADLEPEVAAELRGLAAEDFDLDSEGAERAVLDTHRWLLRRNAKRRQRELTDRLRQPGADVETLLREKESLGGPTAESDSTASKATHPTSGSSAGQASPAPGAPHGSGGFRSAMAP